jgi:hypothetical protein
MQQVEQRYTPQALKESVANWHAVVTANPRPVDPGPELRLPLPGELPGVAQRTTLTAGQRAALQELMALPLDARPQEVIPALDQALQTLTAEGAGTAVKANVQKFDVYDSYFNVTRTQENSGIAFLAGLLQAYRNVIENLQEPPHTLTVVELPMLRLALETILQQFE